MALFFTFFKVKIITVPPASYPDKKIILFFIKNGINKGEKMKKLTLRIDNYTYEKIKLMSKFYNKSFNSMIIELSQIGYLVKEKDLNNEI